MADPSYIPVPLLMVRLASENLVFNANLQESPKGSAILRNRKLSKESVKLRPLGAVKCLKKQLRIVKILSKEEENED